MSSTETVDPRFRDLDAWPTRAAVEAMAQGQSEAIAAVQAQIDAIASAAEAAAARLGATGRLIYAGAGASGRLAVQDGVELGPTFSWPEARVAYLLAGGIEALWRSVEGAEDDRAAASLQAQALALTSADVLIAVAASGRTPYAIAALEAARAAGALTIAITNNAATPLAAAADHALVALTGPEVLAGSTRMKAGTAQKAILNTLSTAIMLRLGRVYQGLMVDMIPSNAKLKERAVRMVATIAACAPEVAIHALQTAQHRIKPAVLVARGLTLEAAVEVLAQHGDNLRAALAEIGGPNG
jgi:N-acetylmuramic acid 6-phosphate etherase